jgi:hypothetical protein
MTTKQIANGLKQLGFLNGWVISGTEIVLWEHDAPQPTQDELKNAAQLWEQTEANAQAQADLAKEAAQAKLAALGLTADDLKALGL